MHTLLTQATHQLHRLKRDTAGANLVEYIILVGVMAIVGLAAFKTLGDNVSTEVNNAANAITGVVP